VHTTEDLVESPWHWRSYRAGHGDMDCSSWCPPGGSERSAPTSSVRQRCTRSPRYLIPTAPTHILLYSKYSRHIKFKTSNNTSVSRLCHGQVVGLAIKMSPV